MDEKVINRRQTVPGEVTGKDNSRGLHNTKLLLKNFRQVVYAVHISEEDLNMRMDDEYGIKSFTLTSNAELAGMDLSGTKMETYTKNLVRSRKMLAIILNALDVLRKDPYDGERLYQILYFSYISEPKPRNRDCLLNCLDEAGYPMTHTTYYRNLNHAIDILDSILWGYTTQDCMHIIESFVGEGETEKTGT